MCVCVNTIYVVNRPTFDALCGIYMIQLCRIVQVDICKLQFIPQNFSNDPAILVKLKISTWTIHGTHGMSWLLLGQ